jgi:hypothetical protein
MACQQAVQQEWSPNTDWGHWILGHRSNFDFLEKNHMTVTFGSGAPNFERVTRAEFDSMMNAAKEFNQTYHDKGYIVLRYLSTALNGRSKSNKDQPKKEQIRHLKFYNESWQDFKDYIGPKPDKDPTTWIMVHPDGSFPHYRYAPYGRETGPGFETWGVPCNPDYVRYMEGKIRAQAETGIDGSYVDWTHIAGGTSYDDYTQSSFIDYLKEKLPVDISRAKYGTDEYDQIDLPKKRGDKFWMEWITFRGHLVAEFHKRLRTVARQYNPHFMISGNIFGGFGFGPIAYDAAGNIEMLGRDGYDDFIYSEMQEYLDAAPRKNEKGVKITNSPAIKFLAAASHGKPVIIYATEITPPIFPDPTEKCLSAMAQINIAEAVANHAIFREKRKTPQGATDIYNFLSTVRDKLIGAHMYSNIAVLASLNQYLADEQSFAFSTSRVLADAGIAHVMIVEDDLKSAYLAQFEVVMLPYIPLLSQEKQSAIKEYVEQGGKLLVLGESGFKNEYNLPHDQIVLASMLGSDAYPEKSVTKQVAKGTVHFIPLDIPDSKYLIPPESKTDVTTFGPSMTDVFADIPEGYTRNRMSPVLRKNLQEMIIGLEQSLSSDLTRLTTASPYLELTTMIQKKDDLLLVHLVNYDVTLDGTVTPVKNIDLNVVIPEGKTAKQVTYSGSLSDMKPVSFVHRGRTLSIKIPDVKIYGLVIVQL